jgi:hypothetical protein
LARHVEAIGGQEAVAAVETLYTKSEVRVDARKVVGVSEMWWRGGAQEAFGRFAVQQSLEGVGANAAGFDGERLWVRDAYNSVRTLAGKEAELYQRGSSPFLIARWRKHFVSAKTLARIELEDGPALELELLTPLDQRVVMVFRESTGLLAEVRFDELSSQGPRPVVARSLDYRVVDGLRFAHEQRTQSSHGELVHKTVEVRTGLEIDEALFANPLGDDRVNVDPSQQ